MKYEIEKLPKNTVKIRITVPVEQVKTLKETVAGEIIKETEVPGFRKGMAPRELAEKKLDTSKVRGEVINRAVSSFYFQAIKEAHLAPIIHPKIEIREFEEEGDLIFEARIAEKPEISLGDYKACLSLAASQSPAKILGADGQEAKPKESEEDVITKVMENVYSVAKIEISDLLIEEEVNHMLSRLIDQTGRLGLTIESYLSSVGKTVEELRSQYRSSAEKSLKTEFLLHEIATREGLTASGGEVEEMIKAAPDEESRKFLSSQENRNYVHSIILKNKAVSQLVKFFEEARDGKN